MPTIKQQILAVLENLLDESSSASELSPDIKRLGELLDKVDIFSINSKQDIAHGETRSTHGQAVSPTMAAMCLREVARTITFMRGLHQAIADCLARRKDNKPIHVLYAGSGPYALLALPSLHAYSKKDIRFTLLDIHSESIDSAKMLIQTLDFTEHITSYHCVDACEFIMENKADIILSETMNLCLTKEPQVAIFKNLFHQSEHALLIPQTVSIDAKLINFSKEHTLLAADSKETFTEPKRDRVHIKTLFTLNRDSLRQWTKQQHRLPANSFVLPEYDDKKYELKLTTDIQVYQHHVLKNYDTSLTIPMTFPSSGTLAKGEKVSLFYQIGEKPGLVIKPNQPNI